MGLDSFSDKGEEGSHVNGDSKEVRPRVSEETHERVRSFTSRAGLNIRDGYDYLIGASLDSQEILEEVLTHDKEYNNGLSSMQKELLSDVVDKWKDLGHFPTREEINKDPSMNGFPIYIINLGKTDRIKELAKEYDSDDLPS